MSEFTIHEMQEMQKTLHSQQQAAQAKQIALPAFSAMTTGVSVVS